MKRLKMNTRFVRQLIFLISLLCIISLMLFFSASVANADQDDVPTAGTTPYQTSVINPTSSFVLYGRDDGTSWLKDAHGDRMILDGHQPRLSPDGRYIVVRRWDTLEGDLYLYDLETKQDTLIFENNNNYVVGFSWSMDGSRMYFDNACVIYAVDSDGSNLEVIIEGWPPDADPTWNNCYNDVPDVNPVDGRLAWHNEWYGIGLSMGDGQNHHWLYNSAPGDFSPRWSLDGEWIAFIRWGSTNNLYKIRPDGSNLTQLTFLSDPDSISFWTGAWEVGGTWLIAPAIVNGVERLYAVATDGSGMMAPLNTAPSSSPVYVGNAGSWDFHFVRLPLVVR
jgi:hypothetical protein